MGKRGILNDLNVMKTRTQNYSIARSFCLVDPNVSLASLKGHIPCDLVSVNGHAYVIIG